MLMSSGGPRLARVRYLDGTIRLISEGDHVLCAVTGKAIPIQHIKYWSVERQEAYADAAASLEAERRA